LYLVLSGLLWGTGGLTGTLLGRAAGLSAISVADYRLLAGGGIIMILRAISARRWPNGRAAWTRIAVTGLLAALFQACYFMAVSLTSVSLATLVTIGGAPVIVQTVERAAGRSGGWRAVLTTGLALCGLGLLVGLPSGGFGQTTMLASAGLALLAAAGFATLTLIGSSPVPGLDDLTVTGFGFTVGGLVLLPLAALRGLTFTPSVATVGLLIALGTGPTAVAYTLYFRGLREATPGIAALLALLEPLTAAILAALVLGDRLTATGITGTILLATAVLRTVREAGGRSAGDERVGSGTMPASLAASSALRWCRQPGSPAPPWLPTSPSGSSSRNPPALVSSGCCPVARYHGRDGSQSARSSSLVGVSVVR
jgi:DME family drug/metabolite transporter